MHLDNLLSTTCIACRWCRLFSLACSKIFIIINYIFLISILCNLYLIFDFLVFGPLPEKQKITAHWFCCPFIGTPLSESNPQRCACLGFGFRLRLDTSNHLLRSTAIPGTVTGIPSRTNRHTPGQIPAPKWRVSERVAFLHLHNQLLNCSGSGYEPPTGVAGWYRIPRTRSGPSQLRSGAIGTNPELCPDDRPSHGTAIGTLRERSSVAFRTRDVQLIGYCH